MAGFSSARTRATNFFHEAESSHDWDSWSSAVVSSERRQAPACLAHDIAKVSHADFTFLKMHFKCR